MSTRTSVWTDHWHFQPCKLRAVISVPTTLSDTQCSMCRTVCTSAVHAMSTSVDMDMLEYIRTRALSKHHLPESFRDRDQMTEVYVEYQSLKMSVSRISASNNRSSYIKWTLSQEKVIIHIFVIRPLFYFHQVISLFWF